MANERSGKGKGKKGAYKGKWEDLVLCDSFSDVAGLHAHSGKPDSLEDLAKVGLLVTYGLEIQPLRSSKAEQAQDGVEMDAFIKARLGLSETKFKVDRDVYDLEYDEWIVWAKQRGLSPRLQINPRMVKDGLRRGILTYRQHGFELQPIRITSRFYRKLLTYKHRLNTEVGWSLKRRLTSFEEKDGVR